MTMSINLKISSNDSFDTEILERVSGEKKINPRGFNYFYENSDGKVNLSFSKNSFKMSKEGEGQIKIYFLENGEGKFTLEAYGLKDILDIKNGKIEYRGKETLISYDIYQRGELINSLKITICEE